MTTKDEKEADPGPVAATFAQLATLLLDAATVQDVLDRVVSAAKAVMPGADMVSVTVRDPDGHYHTPVRTDLLADQLDELQYRHDEGPCVEATRTPGLGTIASHDLAADPRFPTWGPQAAEAGVGCVLAVGLFPGDGPRMGALNLYSFHPHGLDGADRDVALVLAAHASTALAATQACAAKDLQAAQLRRALDSRDVIGQAKGILMERRGIDAAAAFEVLRGASQSLNLKLSRVAELITTRRGEL